MERIRLKGKEGEMVKRMQVALEITAEAKTTFWDRLKGNAQARRDIGIAAAAVKRVFEEVLKTVPTEQLLTIQRNVESTGYTIGTRRPGQKADQTEFGMWVSWEALLGLMDGAREKCMLCDLTPDKQRQCPLAKALDTLPTAKDENARGCGWMGKL